MCNWNESARTWATQLKVTSLFLLLLVCTAPMTQNVGKIILCYNCYEMINRSLETLCTILFILHYCLIQFLLRKKLL